MGRNKTHAPLSKAERKRVKNGARVEDNKNQRTNPVDGVMIGSVVVAQASYVAGSPVPLPLSPGPPVRLD